MVLDIVSFRQLGRGEYTGVWNREYGKMNVSRKWRRLVQVQQILGNCPAPYAPPGDTWITTRHHLRGLDF